MERVIKNFEIYKWTEVILMLIGLTLFIVFFSSNFIFWKGFGISLALAAGIMLALDLIASNRALQYIDSLNKVLLN